MRVDFAKTATLVAIQGTDTTAYSGMQAMGEANYLNLIANVTAIGVISGSTATLTISAEGSNDGYDWSAVAGITDSDTSPALLTAEGDVTFAFVRLKYVLSISGAGGDSGFATFDVAANLVRK